MSIQNNSEENSDYQEDDENDDSGDEYDEVNRKAYKRQIFCFLRNFK